VNICQNIPLLLLVLGCGAGPAEPVSCETAECRQAAVLIAWETSQDEAFTLLAALPSEVERIAATSELISRYPAQVGQLCPRVPRGHSQERCRRAANRNHLHVKAEVGVGGAQTKPATSERRYLAKLFEQPGVLGGVSANPGNCGGSADITSCLHSTAKDAARSQTVQAVAALCKAVPLGQDGSDQWRAECFFQAAESWIRADRDSAYPGAVTLCSQASVYIVHCHRHLLQAMASPAPVGDAKAPAAWAEVQANAATVQANWGGERVGDILVSELWAIAVESAVLASTRLSGDILDQTPDEARGHVRASIAWRLMSEWKGEAQGLQAWSKTMAEVLEVRVGLVGAVRQHSPVKPASKGWPTHLAVAEGLPLARYRGPSIRVKGADAQTDVLICVLEAASRLQPPATSLLEEGAAHADGRVSWTARTLLAGLEDMRAQPAAPSPGVNR
jgi:hypothetical protein